MRKIKRYERDLFSYIEPKHIFYTYRPKNYSAGYGSSRKGKQHDFIPSAQIDECFI